MHFMGLSLRQGLYMFIGFVRATIKSDVLKDSYK